MVLENYINPDFASSSEMNKAQKPLAGAEVYIEEDRGDFDYYATRFSLHPYFQYGRPYLLNDHRLEITVGQNDCLG